MHQSFVQLLACPVCKGDLHLESASAAAQTIEEGTLLCDKGHTFPVTRGIPRFVASEGYAANFGFEWNLHNKTQLDTATERESEETFQIKAGFERADIDGKLVLDVGCGMGRFTDVASRWGATIVGIDLTSAVDAAYANVGARENVHLAQADIFALPFRDETFDVVFSLGVLHHTPDTRAAFDQLPRLVKPGGKIAIWVYGAGMRAWSWVSDIYRVATTRMPKRFLYALCHVAIPMYYVRKVRILGQIAWRLAPMSVHPNRAWRVLDTFDWYSPTYQWKHSDAEVREWFESHGLVDLRPLSFPTSLQGMRPEASAVNRGTIAEVPVGEVSR